MATPAHALRAEELMLKSVLNEGDFTREAEEFFVCISPRTAVGQQKYATWHSLRMRYKQCKLG
jgi:hypothetical protein